MRPKVLAVAILIVVAAGVAVTVIARTGDGRSEGRSAPDVRFDVLDAGCGYRSVVTAQATIPPREGEFCLVRVTITNRGTAAVEVDPSCQLLVSAAGERYAPRSDVLIVDPASRAAFQAPIGRGEVVGDAALYYDVPKGTKPDLAELHAVCGGEPERVEL